MSKFSHDYKLHEERPNWWIFECRDLGVYQGVCARSADEARYQLSVREPKLRDLPSVTTSKATASTPASKPAPAPVAPAVDPIAALVAAKIAGGATPEQAVKEALGLLPVTSRTPSALGGLSPEAKAQMDRCMGIAPTTPAVVQTEHKLTLSALGQPAKQGTASTSSTSRIATVTPPPTTGRGLPPEQAKAAARMMRCEEPQGIESSAHRLVLGLGGRK